MNLIKINEEINDFRDRIIKTLNFHLCEIGMLADQKNLCSWIRQKSIELKKQLKQQAQKKNGMLNNIMTKLLGRETQKQRSPIQVDLNLLSEYVKRGTIPKSFHFASKDIPQNIIKIVDSLKGKKWQKYYGYVKGPFMSDFFILTKEDFHSAIQSVEVNQLKFLMVQEKVAHKYQRNLVQQIFGRIFRQKGCLSLVLKIQVNFDPLQPPYNLFCYIQDVKILHEIQWKPLSCLEQKFNNLDIKSNGKSIEVSEESILSIFLAQILVLPLESLVPDFIVWLRGNLAQLIKCNKQSQEQIIKQKSLKEHPSLRNPLLYFRDYLHEHSIKIEKAQKMTINTELYSCFYRCLQIVIDLMLTDFETEADQTIVGSSVCFNFQVFTALWVTFHKINLLSGWMKEVIEPIKNTITISEIISHFCPIFNQISAYKTQSLESYRQFFLNLDMQNYLATIVNKTSLEKYKDMYVEANQSFINRKFTSVAQIYSFIFKPIMHEVNLIYSDPVQVAHILNFCCKFNFAYIPRPEEIELQWKTAQVWERCIKTIHKEQLPFIDIGLDFMAFSCGINSFKLDYKAFERVKYTLQSSTLLQGVIAFVEYIKNNFQKQSDQILSSLLQKSFKHKKFKICRILLEKKVQIRDFKQIIKSQQQQDTLSSETKENILQAIQISSPQMHRLYKWQQLMMIHLKKKSETDIEITTLQYGKCYIPQAQFQKQIKNRKVVNNLSRKDCRFNSSRQIAYVKINEDLSFYIEANQFPLMPYFYKIFFNKLEVPELMFNFTSFFHENRMFYISESLPQGLNLKKGLATFTEQEICSMTDTKLIAEAIVLSMILVPASIRLEDILISPSREGEGEIFIIDWHSFYQKNYMCKYAGKTILNSRNSLFLTEIMNKAIHPSVIKKYAHIDVMQICQSIFIQCKKFTESVHQLYKLEQDPNEPTKQLLAMIFESGFILSLAERMFKIKRIFQAKEQNEEKDLSYYKLLENLHSQTSYYYQQVASTSIFLRERQIVLSDQNWKRSFLHASITQFFGIFRKLQQVQNIFPDHYYRFCFQGPSQSLADATINMKKFKAFSDQIPQNFSEYPNQFFEYIMKNIDLKKYPIQTRKFFIQTIKTKSLQYLDSSDKRVLPLSAISLKSVEDLKQTYFHQFSFQRVQELIVENCILNAFDFKSVPQSLGNVMYLQLKDIGGLRYIGENTLGGIPLEIRHLKTLSIVDCYELISVDIKCDILECLQLRNNQQLQTIYIYSLNFKNIYLYNNPNIHIQNLGMYIIKGIDVLKCRNSCRGDLSKLYTSKYQNYVNNILKQLITSFFIKENRYVMLLTLCKMREVSEELFARAGLSTFRSVSSIFRTFSQGVQDRLLSEIFRLYFSNPYLTQVVIGQISVEINKKMPEFQIDRMLKIISSGLSKITHQKMFKSLRVQNSSLIFSILQKSQVKTLIDLVKTEKFFTVQFKQLNCKMNPNSETSNENNFSNQNLRELELIRYLSMEKDDIEKMTLIFTESTIGLDFVSRIFENTFTLQEMKNQEQQMFKKNLVSKLSRLISKRSLNEQYPKHMKINRLTFQNCKINDFRQANMHQLKRNEQQTKQQQNGLIQIQSSLQQPILPPQFSKPKIQNNIMEKPIRNKKLEFRSIKQLSLIGCKLQSFQILYSLPNLNTLKLKQCSVEKQTNDFYQDLLDILVGRDIKHLELEDFFKGSGYSEQFFKQFCAVLKKMPSLKVLKLNNNVLTFKNMNTLSQMLNETDIQQLELDKLTLLEKQLQHKISFADEKIQLLNQLKKKKQELNSAHLRNFLKSTKNLKSLVLQLRSPFYVQQFIKSLSENTSLLYLTLNTSHQIPSMALTPLNSNTTLNNISSNMQLPVWLLNHVKSNRIGDNKKKVNVYSVYDPENQENSNGNSTINQYSSIVGNSSKINECFKMGLSLDGGGMRGMLLATELEYLAKEVGYPLHKIFDCVGGTSIGGILALLSTGTLDGYNPILGAEQLSQLFTKFGNDIFKKSQFRQLKSLFQSKYSSQSYEEVLKNYFKDCKLSNCLQDTNVIVTAVNRMDNKDYVFRSKEALLSRQKDFYLRDVARATSAAPTYFPSAQIKNVNASLKLSLVDGGLGMNNPSKLVIDQVKKISANYGTTDNYFLVSLGTGKLPSQNIPQSAGLKDISPIIDTYAESSNYFLERDLSINYKGHFFRVSPSISLADKTSGELDNTSDEAIDNYRRTGLEASKKYFKNTVIFGRYRNMNLIEWLRQNTARKEEY